jgi:hypothetical protein
MRGVCRFAMIRQFHQRTTRIGLTSLLALFLSASVVRAESDPSQSQPPIGWVPPPADATEADKKAAGELVGIFSGPCLGKFPDDNAVESYTKEKNLTPMTVAEIRHLLGPDPGMGWIGQASSTRYLLTIEKPPYHTCAIRKMFTSPPRAVRSYYFLALALWAVASKHGTVTEQPPQSLEIEGRPTQAYVYPLTDAGGTAREQFLLFVSDMSDGTYAIRLARQILPN